MVGYRKPEERPPHPLKRFAREKAAYEHLLHFGACAKGVVPNCFGWLELTSQERDSLVELPNLTSHWRHLRNDDGLPKALLLEYLEEAKMLSIENITVGLADKAVRALYHIHAAYVLHNDVHGRNVLVLPSGRVVWIDFDAAMVANPSIEARSVSRYDLLDELANSWDWFYNTMVRGSPSWRVIRDDESCIAHGQANRVHALAVLKQDMAASSESLVPE